MKKVYVPYEKLSKKARREADARGRATWGSMSPVTRKAPRQDVYDRSREKRRWAKAPYGELGSGGAFCLTKQMRACYNF